MPALAMLSEEQSRRGIPHCVRDDVLLVILLKWGAAVGGKCGKWHRWTSGRRSS